MPVDVAALQAFKQQASLVALASRFNAAITNTDSRRGDTEVVVDFGSKKITIPRAGEFRKVWFLVEEHKKTKAEQAISLAISTAEDLVNRIRLFEIFILVDDFKSFDTQWGDIAGPSGCLPDYAVYCQQADALRNDASKYVSAELPLHGPSFDKEISVCQGNVNLCRRQIGALRAFKDAQDVKERRDKSMRRWAIAAVVVSVVAILFAEGPINRRLEGMIFGDKQESTMPPGKLAPAKAVDR